MFGAYAGQALTTGQFNTVMGAFALDGATTPSGNSAFGYEAGGAVTTGASNVFVGVSAGYTTTTGSNNIILGNSATASSATVSNEITLGNTSTTKFRVPGLNFIIKDSTATDNYVLTVDASGEAGWEAAGGAGGGGSDEIFWENGQNVTTNYTITNGKNAMSAGPITVDAGVTVTVGAGETWTVV